jgi:hypothetical protein
MEVSGQLHPAGWVAPCRSGHGGEKKNSYHCPARELKPASLARSPVYLCQTGFHLLIFSWFISPSLKEYIEWNKK